MAAHESYSRSPQVSDRASLRLYAHNTAPITPVHSPHHSVTSSISTRTPLHTLSIHEYRKQQNTPGSQTATPVGKTLRRKAAAPALNGIERAPEVRAIHSDAQLSARPLQSSQSAHQLYSHRPPLPQQSLSDQIFHSQSAEPRTQGGSISSISTTTSTGKIRQFNSRKRLPKPPVVTGFLPFPPHLATVKPNLLHRPPLLSALEFSTEDSHSSDARTTHTASTFSLSRFPKPPHLTDASCSPPHNENERTRINALSFASTAPATPPATPATIHYRGASFDLVNPHDSLLLHDIVTPSKDFGSSECLLARTSEEPLVASSEMAPKRALYGDLSAAHAGIMRRAEDSFSSSNFDLPLPPTPAAVSPDSSTYTSPMYSQESNIAPSPLAVKKVPADSRFSLKQLTRTLTKRLGKSPEKQHGQELQELGDPDVHIASISMEGNFPRPLEGTYVATPRSAYFPVSPTSPITPTSSMSPQEQASEQDEGEELELSRGQSIQRYDTEPLTSLIPDDYSTQLGRVDNTRMSMSEEHLNSRPYYDDLDSIYPSSSVYTGDDRRRSNYQQSFASARQSNPFIRYSGLDATSFSNEFSQDSLYGYSLRSHGKSKPTSQDMYHRSVGQEKTDTISKIIDQYDPSAVANNTMSIQSHGTSDPRDLPASEIGTVALVPPNEGFQQVRATTGLSQFEFGLQHDAKKAHKDNVVHRIQSTFTRRPTMTRDVGLPPRAPAPLAPAFQYGDAPHAFPHLEKSEMFSNRSSSYGDTRNLLQIALADVSAPPVSGPSLQPSSSYSQPEAKLLEPSSSHSQGVDLPSPQTPQEALDEAEQIFRSAASEQSHREKGIPAMWARRSSGSLLLTKKATSQPAKDSQSPESPDMEQGADIEGNDADWESVAGHSHGVRDSLNSRGLRDSFDSVADYSSSEGTPNSLGLNSNGSLPSWAGQNHSQGPSIYNHPSPIRAHHHPFSSSPPQLQPPAKLHTARESSSPLSASSPPGSTTVPVFGLPSHPQDVLSRSAVEQPYALAPWVDPYAFSDKETQELLASGPNDKIMFDNKRESADLSNCNAYQHRVDGVMPISSSPVSVFDGPSRLERENTFEKLCVIGPKGNLTGTPRGTGMHETGSSVADTSSPGLMLTSSIARGSLRSDDYPGFYASTFPATGSVTRVHQSPSPAEPDYERATSQMTLFPKISELEPVIETPLGAGASCRPSLRCSTTFQRAQRRVSRNAVPGQTKLRQMILSPEAARKTLSSADTNFSRFMGGSERPSTSDTVTPLRPHLSVETIPTVRTLIAHQHSPHLLCPERGTNSEDEERRRKLSWAILAVFCLLPPCIILFRIWGDTIIISLTEGRLGHCTNKSKKVALIAGITVNIGIATAIVVPIAIAHALGAA